MSSHFDCCSTLLRSSRLTAPSASLRRSTSRLTFSSRYVIRRSRSFSSCVGKSAWASPPNTPRVASSGEVDGRPDVFFRETAGKFVGAVAGRFDLVVARGVATLLVDGVVGVVEADEKVVDVRGVEADDDEAVGTLAVGSSRESSEFEPMNVPSELPVGVKNSGDESSPPEPEPLEAEPIRTEAGPGAVDVAGILRPTAPLTTAAGAAAGVCSFWVAVSPAEDALLGAMSVVRPGAPTWVAIDRLSTLLPTSIFPSLSCSIL